MATVLNLDRITPTDNVLINGVSYWLRPADALTLRQYKIVDRNMPRLFEILAQDDLTEDEDVEAISLMQQLCEVVLEAPADVRAGLTDVQRLQVFMAFTPLRSKLNLPTNGATATTAPMAGPSIGASGSRDSSSTTAARRKAGSTRSRRA
jgi:hypothetical protein